MVTFADLMALLFALFVLLLSFSEVDSDSFQKNAGPMREAFNMLESPAALQRQSLPMERAEAGQLEEEVWKDDLMYHLRVNMAREISREEITLVEKDREIIIRFPDATAFPPGGSRLTEKVMPTIDRVAEVLANAEGQIVVAGHTDNIPISTSVFRSNWDLSTSRSVSVVHRLLTNPNLPPDRVTAQGFADSRSLATNETPEGRSANRRVEISIQMPETRPNYTER